MSKNPTADAAGSPRPHFLLQDAEGIDALIAHLTTHLKSPRIEVAVDAFPPADAHRARARIAHYGGKSGMAAALLVAGVVVLISTGILIPTTYRNWNYLVGWGIAQNLTKAIWMIIPPVVAGTLVYMAVEAWIRVKLLQELKRLRKRSTGWVPEQAAARPTTEHVHGVQQAGVAGSGFAVLSRLSELHIVQLHALYQQEWWCQGRSLDATRRGVKGSQVVIGIANTRNELIAFARVLTDYTFKALIFDVVVAESSRHQQLGRRLMELITAHEELQAVRHFELYCLPELVEFYVSHGFSTEVGNVQLMRRVREAAE